MLQFKTEKGQVNTGLTLKLCVILSLVMFLLAGNSRVFASEIHNEQTQKKTTTSILENRSNVPKISPKELISRLKKGELILVVDVRSVQEYTAGYIPGSISIPLAEVESRINDFPRKRDIVFY